MTPENRHLIAGLADRYRGIAPDLPGFGFADDLEQRQYQIFLRRMSSDHAGVHRRTRSQVLRTIRFDYGAPTGFRLDMARPERVTAIVSQNGNAYVEGLGDARAPSRRCWMHPTSENREAIRKGLDAEGVRGEYSVGIPNRSCEANVIDMFIRKIRQITEAALRVSGDQNLGMRVDVALGSGGRCGGPYIPITQAAGEMRLETVRIPSGVGIRWFLRCPLGSTCRVPKTEERRTSPGSCNCTREPGISGN